MLPAPQPEVHADDDGGDDQNRGEHRRTDPYRGAPLYCWHIMSGLAAFVQVCPCGRSIAPRMTRRGSGRITGPLPSRPPGGPGRTAIRGACVIPASAPLCASRRTGSAPRVGTRVRRDPPPAAAAGRGDVLLALASGRCNTMAMDRPTVIPAARLSPAEPGYSAGSAPMRRRHQGRRSSSPARILPATRRQATPGALGRPARIRTR